MLRQVQVSVLRIVLLVFVFTSLPILYCCREQARDNLHFFSANDQRIRKVGRFFSGSNAAPTVYAPGAYFEFAFTGTRCEVLIQDEQRFGNQNYIVFQIDQQTPIRLQLKEARNTIVLQAFLQRKPHWVRICKASESTTGFIALLGICCEQLHAVAAPKLLFEFIGDSITCGNGADSSQLSFGAGTWSSYHNAYMSYGPLLSRAFKADWRLSSVSGIGMSASCCGSHHTMPQVYEQIGFNTYKKKLNFKKQLQPDIVFITLGQNDNLHSKNAPFEYERNYYSFLLRLRGHYPKASIICCNSPMATISDKVLQNRCLKHITDQFRRKIDSNIYYFAFQGIYRSGNDKHPTLAEHQRIKGELARFLKQRLHLSPSTN